MHKFSFLIPVLVLMVIGCANDPSSPTTKDKVTVDEISEVESIEKPPISISFGDLSIEVVPSIGGRLGSLSYKGKQMLASKRDAENLHWGSTVWPSPQSQWDWPPPAIMDQAAYEVKSLEPKMVLLESPPNAYLGIIVKKRYHLRDPRTLDITYQFFNEQDTTIQVGIWENTRIDYTGQISWGTDENFKEEISNLTEVADETRLILEDQKENKKLFINSSKGWVAYQKNGVQLKKTFPVIPLEKIAKNQAQIEIYLAPNDGYAEIEEHGALEELGPGQVAQFRVRWSLSEPL